MSNLSEVMVGLGKSVEASKKLVVGVAEQNKDDRQVAEYAAETVGLLGEIEGALETAAARLKELEDAGAFQKRAVVRTPARTVPPLRRKPVHFETVEEAEAAQDETSRPGLEESIEREPDPDTEVEGELSGEAISAIVQFVEADRAHQAAMNELQEAQVALSTAKAGGKRDASLRVAKAQAAVVETWTARKESYALQELLADRGSPG